MRPRPTLAQRLRCAFDNAMARGPIALIGLLALATFVIEIYLKPAGDSVEPGRATTFATVVEAARRRGEMAKPAEPDRVIVIAEA